MQLSNAKVGITGSSGFIGQHLVSYLSSQSMPYISLSDRYPFESGPELSDVQTIVHLAGLVHGKSKSKSESKAINGDFPIELATIAKKEGVKRFIFISSVNIYQENSSGLISEEHVANPISYQAIHKFHAENELLKLCSNDFSVVILRLPLVYAYNAPANFSRLMTISRKFALQPFALAEKKRSYLSIDNLMSAIFHVLKDRTNVSGCFNVTDCCDISTKELITNIRHGFGLKTYQVPIPPKFIKILFIIFRKEKMFTSLFCENRFDSEKFQNTFCWEPVKDPFDALANMRSIYD